MKATEANLLKFLKKSPQFVIPIYQRNYSWLPEECCQLWADLLRAGRNDVVAAHFIGSMYMSSAGCPRSPARKPCSSSTDNSD